MNAIEIEGLRKTYRASGGMAPKVALDGIDLAVPRGSIFGLLGPNGAGKSTLINILAGLVVKTAGKVRIWGFDQDINPRQSRASIGVMPQELNLDAFFTPRMSLETQAGLYGVPRKLRQTRRILDLIGLADKADAYARTLSGGMRRRLLLGKALVHAPPVLVLDEPTAGVDLELRQMLWTNVRALNDDGVTVILTTHYLEEAEAMCDRIAIIDRGRLVANESTAQLLGRLETKTLVIRPAGAEDSPAPDTLARALPRGARVVRRPDGRLAVSYNPTTQSAGAILNALDAAGVVIGDIATEEPDLEDVFLSLTSTARG